MKTQGAPTMKDVASEAGVSLGTVSKVINGIPVGASYRKRVDAAIEKLGYHVNNYARGLKTNRTGTVALLMPSLSHPFFALLTDALTASLMQRDCRSLLLITNYDPDAERKCFVLSQQNKVDGIIALTYSPDLDGVDDSASIVTIDRHFPGRIPCVSSDNFAGGELAAEKLTQLGCRKLLFLGIGSDILGEPHRRGPGFESFCRRSGTDFETVILREAETEAPFFSFLRSRIRNGKLDFDGIFCNTDGLAVRVLDFLRSLDIRVPEDVQVIGYDGIRSYATGAYLCSTIVQPIEQMAEAAVSLVLNRDAVNPPVSICLPVRYAFGGTTREQA